MQQLQSALLCTQVFAVQVFGELESAIECVGDEAFDVDVGFVARVSCDRVCFWVFGPVGGRLRSLCDRRFRFCILIGLLGQILGFKIRPEPFELGGGSFVADVFALLYHLFDPFLYKLRFRLL